MPKVKNVYATAKPKGAPANIILITQEELAELKAANEEFARINQLYKQAEDRKALAEAVVAEKSTGLIRKNYNLLDDKKIAKIIEQREENGVFAVEPGKLDFTFKTNSPNGTRYPKWKELCIEVIGTTAEAERFASERTPLNYGWFVEVE